MRKFTGRFVWLNNDEAYKKVLAQRDKAEEEWKELLDKYVAPAHRDEIDALHRRLIYTHQQTVWWQTEHEVEDKDIRTY